MIFHGLAWCPKSFKLESKLQELGLTGLTCVKAPDHIEGMTKPTLFKTNEFLFPFQEIVNTYGIPTYKEVNPALFAVVSFPFLFGVMFGDVMHGTWLVAFSSWLCWTDKSNSASLAGMMAPFRYLLLLMGVFSLYMGLIYNDFTSMPTLIMGSTCYTEME